MVRDQHTYPVGVWHYQISETLDSRILPEHFRNTPSQSAAVARPERRAKKLNCNMGARVTIFLLSIETCFVPGLTLWSGKRVLPPDCNSGDAVG